MGEYHTKKINMGIRQKKSRKEGKVSRNLEVSHPGGTATGKRRKYKARWGRRIGSHFMGVQVKRSRGLLIATCLSTAQVEEGTVERRCLSQTKKSQRGGVLLCGWGRRKVGGAAANRAKYLKGKASDTVVWEEASCPKGHGS